ICNLRLGGALTNWPTFQSKIGQRGSVMVLVCCIALAQGLEAKGNSSLSESNIEGVDTRVTAAAMLPQDEELRRQLSLARESVKTLTGSLAVSNGEAEVFRRKYSDLQLRMEALGIESVTKERAKLEQRLLNA